ncbi:8796_t:CDS:2 [Funneliformis geosporum]|uniref:18674_t:CDS:1 n=1 Tax=Funneliformis geosporum TaxID=1117311 RepID=A0A9W4SM35_9GLOM|nr:18674_t:CDS:2 [Funneliformis geosporum]CAI2178393.1 8796_t:CDS:2 [Funneliformis geosporum]
MSSDKDIKAFFPSILSLILDKMFSRGQRGSDYKKRGRARQIETYRSWNVESLGMPPNVDDSAQYRPWNAAALSVESESSMDIDEKQPYDDTQRPTLIEIDETPSSPVNLPKLANQDNHQSSQNQNSIQSNMMEELKQLNWEDYTKQLMQEEAKRSMEIRRQKQNVNTCQKILSNPFNSINNNQLSL